MTEEDISQEFRLKKIKSINKYFIKEVDQNELMSNENKKAFTSLNYIERFLTLVFAVTECIFFSAFASSVNLSTKIMSSSKGLSIFWIIVKIKKYKSIIKKKKKEAWWNSIASKN